MSDKTHKIHGGHSLKNHQPGGTHLHATLADHSKSTSSMSTYSSMTSKTILPSQFNLPPPDERRKRRIKETSAWTPGAIYVRDFSTQQADSYEDPAVHLHHMDAEDEKEKAKREAWEANRKVLHKSAMEKLADVANAKYGNMVNMLKAFKKSTGDTITLPEFAEHLRRRNMDAMLPLEDQELVWEQLRATARGSVDVGLLAKKVDECTPKPAVGDDKDILALRNFLAQQVEERRRAQAAGTGTDSKRGDGADENTTDTILKQALGQKTFGLDLGAEEFDNVVEDLFAKKHTKAANEKFSRFLRMTNVKLNAIPFYDLRSDELARLKQRAKAIGQELQDPSISIRLRSLEESSRATLENDLAQSRMSRLSLADTNSNSNTMSSKGRSGQMSLHSANELEHSPVKKQTGGGGSGAGVTGSHLEGHSHIGEASFTQGHSGSHSAYPTAMLDTAASALFGESDPSMYHSTYSEYFPPLRYAPNQPITRDVVSDADIKCKVRNQRRKLRQQRTQSNVNVTQERLEKEGLKALSRKLCGEQARTEDMIRYQTTVFLHDLKCYKRLPLQTMQKKPNLTKSEAMWGGSTRFDEANKPDNRDFVTTFKDSFLENAPKAEPVIDIESRVRLMYQGKGKVH
jgi:hypothetical protein